MNIDQDLTKCLVITNYRTGSTSFCDYNAEKNNLLNLYEVLHEDGEYHAVENIENLLKYTDRFIAKVMPDQFAYDFAKLQMLIQHCDQIVYLYRKDFTAQCLSWIAMQHLQDWHVKPQSNIQHSINFYIDIDQAFADKHSKVIRDNNNFLKECVKRYPAQVYAYEDIHDNKPYKRFYNWEYKPYIKPYNTEEMFYETTIQSVG